MRLALHSRENELEVVLLGRLRNRFFLGAWHQFKVQTSRDGFEL